MTKSYKIKDPDAPLSPAQAKYLWAFEVRHSACKPHKWHSSTATKQQASDIIEVCKNYETATVGSRQSTLLPVHSAITAYNPDFRWKTDAPTRPTQPPVPKAETIVKEKEVVKTVTLTPDMDLNTVIETIFPVVKGAPIIKDIYDNKPVPLPKVPKSPPKYYKPANFNNIYASIQCQNINVLLTGPSGCGKSKMAEVMADMLKLPYYCQDCSENTTMLDLKGSTGIKDGNTRFEFSGLMKAIQEPGLTLIDEVFALESRVLIGLNGLFEPNNRTVNTKGGLVTMHKDHILMLASNINGRNIDRNHVGAGRVDGSSLDRVVTYPCDYSHKAEKQLANALPKIQRLTILHWLSELRKGVKTNNIAFAPSTRRLVSCISLMQGNLPPDVAFTASFLGQLSATEIKKIGLNNLDKVKPIVEDEPVKDEPEWLQLAETLEAVKRWKQLADEGKTAVAITECRIAHCVDLKSAKAMVEEYLANKEQGDTRTWQQLADDGLKIDAIRACRIAHCIDLKAAKAVVVEYLANKENKEQEYPF